MIDIGFRFKCPYRQNFYFLISFFISPNELLRKKIDLDKMQSFLEVFENVQICRHFGPPVKPLFPWFGMSCYVD